MSKTGYCMYISTSRFSLSDTLNVALDTEFDDLAPNTLLNFPFFLAGLGSLSDSVGCWITSNSLDCISSSSVRTAICSKSKLSLNLGSRNEQMSHKRFISLEL